MFVYHPNKCLALLSPTSSDRCPLIGSTQRRQGREGTALNLSGCLLEEVGMGSTCLGDKWTGMNCWASSLCPSLYLNTEGSRRMVCFQHIEDEANLWSPTYSSSHVHPMVVTILRTFLVLIFLFKFGPGGTLHHDRHHLWVWLPSFLQKWVSFTLFCFILFSIICFTSCPGQEMSIEHPRNPGTVPMRFLRENNNNNVLRNLASRKKLIFVSFWEWAVARFPSLVGWPRLCDLHLETSG